MLLDHLGVFFLPQVFWLRWLGRLAFPLFGWMIANGARNTHSEKKYLKRLLVFAVISQWPYVWVKGMLESNFWGLNVIFTLVLGLVAIMVVKRKMNKLGKIGLVMGLCAVAIGLQTDYGVTGVLSVLASYVFFERWKVLVGVQTVIFFGVFVMVGLWNYLALGKLQIGISGYNEMLAPLAFLLIYFYNGKMGPKAKYLFYVVYPLQFVIIGMVKRGF
jgi:hypothetical protein